MAEQDDLRMEREVAMAVDDAFEADLAPIPPELSRFALDALQWRLVDDELAAITFDSMTDELVGIRGTATMRHSLRFEGSGIAVSTSVSEGGLVASIEPAAVYNCRIEGPRTSLDVVSDSNGQLAVTHSELPIRLVVEFAGGRRFVTPWVTG